MIQNLSQLQQKSKYPQFAKRLTDALRNRGVEPSPSEVANAFNKYYKVTTLKPHTVRKWILGASHPKTEMLLMIADWVNLPPQDLLIDTQAPNDLKNKISFEFNFTDQEVIAKYLTMTVKEKITVRLVIDAITNKQK
jgi:hypothetical protein